MRCVGPSGTSQQALLHELGHGVCKLAGRGHGQLSGVCDPVAVWCWLQMKELMNWVTDNRLEDEEFMALSTQRAKKADYVKYVQKRLSGLP